MAVHHKIFWTPVPCRAYLVKPASPTQRGEREAQDGKRVPSLFVCEIHFTSDGEEIRAAEKIATHRHACWLKLIALQIAQILEPLAAQIIRDHRPFAASIPHRDIPMIIHNERLNGEDRTQGRIPLT
jgi:hypothetical protein